MERGFPPACARIQALVLVLLTAVAGPVSAQDLSEEQFVESSLRYRTALHYDPLLEAPLEALVGLYRSSERLDELIGLYKSHIEQYPNDAGAKTVLIRVLRRIDRSGADELISSAVPLHPEYAPLQFLLFRFFEERGDARSTEALSRAIDLESNPARRNEWLDHLLQLSEGEAARSLAMAHFEKLLTIENQSPDALTALAQLMQRYQFWNLSIAALNKAKAARPSPEAEVEVELMLATAQSQLGNRADAGRILDALHGRLSADHWRRREVMSLRVNVLANDEERLALLTTFEAAYRKNPHNEAAILDYVELLFASEKKTEATDLLLEASALLPKSKLIEARTIEMLESQSNYETYSRFLEQKLENEPERIDLRFLLVKANYALGQDAAAEQDFKAVVAGLPPGEASGKILELQRFLRSIDRIDAATPYLEGYIRNHPTRLDIARELAEIYLTSGSRAKIEAVVRLINAEEAEAENVLDFTEFLLREEFFNAARSLLGARLKIEPNQFDLGLLLIRLLGRMGDSTGANQQIASLRELTDSPERYSQWLQSSVEAHTNLESVSRFFDSEQNRFNFTDGEWSEDKVAKFLALCEVGRQQLFTDRVSRRIREQLEQPGLEAKLRMRLRAFLVGVIERDPGAAAEVEQQLKLLATEDPANSLEYNLRRALVFHRSQRVDLAQELLAGIDLTEVTSAALLRESADTLIEYGFLKEAESALAAINRLEPTDLLSWERRLTILVTLEQESVFRSALRSFRNNENGVTLRDLSMEAVEEHLNSSYWRSISALLSAGESELDEILPLIASVEREEMTSGSRLWAEWTRALVLYRLGRADEAAESITRFRTFAESQSIQSLTFPDGLVLAVDAASDFLTPSTPVVPEESGAGADFLLNESGMRWAFELKAGANILHFGRSDDRVIILDDQGSVYSIDALSGKLVWRKSYDEMGNRSIPERPRAFAEVPSPPTLNQRTFDEDMAGKAPRSFAISGGTFFLAFDGQFGAFSVADGSPLWLAPTHGEGVASAAVDISAARAEVHFAVENGRALVFEPARQAILCFGTESGKLLWEILLRTEPDRKEEPLHSLNAGLSLSGGHAFVYGRDSVIIDVASGRVVWTLNGEQRATFPLILRMQREGETASADGESPPPLSGLPSGGNELRLVDFQTDTEASLPETSEVPSGATSLVGPAVYWAKRRLLRNEASYASISDGYLWLMQGGKVRRISIRLPVASRELPASGTFLGQTGNHAWFLDGGTIHHLDFVRDRSSILSLRDLGDPSKLRACLTGKQLLIRGGRSYKVFNALSGELIGQGTLPPVLLEHLGSNGSLEGEESEVRPVWQGRIHRRSPGEPGYSFPVMDLISDTRYYTVFDRRVLVCIEPLSQLPRATVSPSPPVRK